MWPRLVLLDRDGVINVDSDHYILGPDEWHAIPGSIAAIARLNAAGRTVAVCTNQSAVGRGMLSEQTLAAIHDRMHREVAAAGGALSHVLYCPHAPEAHCDCRKPAPGLIQAALRLTGIGADQTLFIGDSARDLEAARRAGVAAWLVATGNGSTTARTRQAPPPMYSDLAHAVNALLEEP